VDEEDIPGLSFLAFWQTVIVMLYLLALSAPGGTSTTSSAVLRG